MRRIHAISVVFAGLTAVLAPGAFAQSPERYSVPGNQIAVYNLAGAVTIERGTGSNVVIEVVRGGRDAAELDVERIEVEGRPTLVVRYPDDDVVYAGRGRGTTQVSVRSDGTFGGGMFRSRRVTIRGSGRGMEAHADLRIRVPAGHELDMYLGAGEVTATDVAADLNIDVHTATVRTRGTTGSLLIDTGSGSVVVDGAEGDDVTIDTGSGSVQANGIRSNRLSIDTGSGRVTGEGIAAESVEVDTGSGSIALTNVTARDIELDTGSGRVTLDLASQIDRLVIDTGSGSVRLSAPANLSASLEIDTGSGGIDVDIPVTVRERDRSSLIGTIGSGSGSIEIDTGSGGVTIVAR